LASTESPGRIGSLARGSYKVRRWPLRRGLCEYGGVGFGPVGCSGLVLGSGDRAQGEPPPTMGGESPRAIKHPAVIGLGGLRAPVTVVGEVFGCQRTRNCIGKDVDER